jgi:hypothetical protein
VPETKEHGFHEKSKGHRVQSRPKFYLPDQDIAPHGLLVTESHSLESLDRISSEGSFRLLQYARSKEQKCKNSDHTAHPVIAFPEFRIFYDGCAKSLNDESQVSLSSDEKPPPNSPSFQVASSKTEIRLQCVLSVAYRSITWLIFLRNKKVPRKKIR